MTDGDGWVVKLVWGWGGIVPWWLLLAQMAMVNGGFLLVINNIVLGEEATWGCLIMEERESQGV